MTCPFCQAQRLIPDDYVRWRQQNQEALAAEERVAALHKSLGKTPRWWEQAVVSIDGKGAGCLMAFLVLYLGNMVLTGSIHVFNFVTNRLSHFVTPDTFGAKFLTLLLVSPFALVSLALLLGILYVRRKVKTLSNLQANFVAASPVHDGGPAGCRKCGAPLVIEPGKVSASCHYCCSHNLVALDPSWTNKLRADVNRSNLTLAEALDVYDLETAQARGRFFKYLRNIFVIGALVFLLFSSGKSGPSYEESIVNHRLLLGKEQQSELPLSTPILFKPMSGEHGVLVWGPFRSGAGEIRFRVGLKDVDSLKITSLKTSEGSLTVNFGHFNKRKPRWEETKTLMPGDSTSFKSLTNRWLDVQILPDETAIKAGCGLQFDINGGNQRISAPILWPELTVSTLSLGETIRRSEFQQDKEVVDKVTGTYKNQSVTLDDFDRIVEIQITEPVKKGSRILNKEPVGLFLKRHGLGQVLFDQSKPGRVGHTYSSQDRELRLELTDDEIVSLSLKQLTPLTDKPVATKTAEKEGATSASPQVLAKSLDAYKFKPNVRLDVQGLIPGVARAKVEKILGPAALEWGRYALHGSTVVCYWNGKVRWLCSDVLSQGGEHFRITGFEDSLSKRFGEPVLKLESKLTNSSKYTYEARTTFYRKNGQLLGIHLRDDKLWAVSILGNELLKDLSTNMNGLKLGQSKAQVIKKLGKLGQKRREEETGKEIYWNGGGNRYTSTRFDGEVLDGVSGWKLNFLGSNFVIDSEELDPLLNTIGQDVLFHAFQASSQSNVEPSKVLNYVHDWLIQLGDTRLKVRWSGGKWYHLAWYSKQGGFQGRSTPE